MTEMRLNFHAVLQTSDLQEIQHVHKTRGGLSLVLPDGGALHLNESTRALVAAVMDLAVTGRILLDLILEDPALTGEQLLERAVRHPGYAPPRSN